MDYEPRHEELKISLSLTPVNRLNEPNSEIFPKLLTKLFEPSRQNHTHVSKASRFIIKTQGCCALSVLC